MSETEASTSKAEASSDIDVEAATLLSQGRRHLLVEDSMKAVQCLQEACQLLGTKYGELADECGESYYYYGWALLEVARMETGVLGNALQGVPEDEEAEEEGGETDNVENPDKVEDEAKEPVKDKSEAEEKTEDKTEDDGTEDEDGEEEEGAKGEDTKDDDISNFQLSWEMLELARIIFSKHDNDEFKLKVAQVYLKLGEHGLETGNYTQSIEDFSQCLTRQKEQLGNDSRLLAETHYNLALAYSFDQKFDKAIKSYEQSSVMIQNRIATLKKKATDTDKPLSEEEGKQNEKEIGELEALGPEIKAKIDDAKAEKNSAESAVGQAMRGAAAEFGLGTSSSSGFAPASCGEPAKPIAVRKATDTKPDDISYLVHRKRKPEDAPQEESSIKKSRQEDEGGDAKPSTNGVKNATNGDEKLANGDAKTKKSAEKEEIKVKQVEQASNSGTETAAMET